MVEHQEMLLSASPDVGGVKPIRVTGFTVVLTIGRIPKSTADVLIDY